MTDHLRARMEWVQRNRTPRNRSMPAGAAVADFARKLWTQDIGPAEAAADALTDLVDEEFRRHCRVAALAKNVLTIQVHPAAMVEVMRRKWSTRIKRELPAMLSRGINRVAFQHGSAGAVIGDVHEAAD